MSGRHEVSGQGSIALFCASGQNIGEVGNVQRTTVFLVGESFNTYFCLNLAFDMVFSHLS